MNLNESHFVSSFLVFNFFLSFNFVHTKRKLLKAFIVLENQIFFNRGHHSVHLSFLFFECLFKHWQFVFFVTIYRPYNELGNGERHTKTERKVRMFGMHQNDCLPGETNRLFYSFIYICSMKIKKDEKKFVHDSMICLTMVFRDGSLYINLKKKIAM